MARKKKTSIQKYIDGLSEFGKSGAEDPSLTAGPELIKMKCEDREADVHPDEVENYTKGGYLVV